MNLAIDTSALMVGGLVATRTLTFLMSMPVLGVRNVPAPVRIAIALWMAIAVLPAVLEAGARVPDSALGYALAMSIEVLAGVLLSFGAVTLFAAVQFAGQVIGIQMGLAMANVLDPTTDLQISVISQVYNLLAILIFLAIDGHLALLQGLQDSFLVLVPGTFVPATAGFLETTAQVGSIYTFAMRLALPVILSLLLVSLSLGIVGRTVPQLNILVLGFPVKILVGSFVLMASIPIFGDVIVDLIEELPERLGRIVLAAASGR